MLMEEKGELDVWWCDESSFNVNLGPKPNFGWAPLGKSPICSVPTKGLNLSLLCAIAMNKKPYY